MQQYIPYFSYFCAEQDKGLYWLYMIEFKILINEQETQ